MMDREGKLERQPELSPLQQDIDAHADRFGKPPALRGVLRKGREAAVTTAIRAAVREGKPFDVVTVGAL